MNEKRRRTRKDAPQAAGGISGQGVGRSKAVATQRHVGNTAESTAGLALRPDPLRASNSDSATAQLWRVLQHSLLAGLEVQPVRTLAELERAHWSAWCGFSTMARTCERWLPAPPLPPPPPQLGARRLADESDLAEEGAKMQHCIANPTGKYVAQLRAGRAAVFHLSSPAPATVYLVHCGERWHFGEMNGVRNARPPVGQERLVRGWLASMDTAQPT